MAYGYGRMADEDYAPLSIAHIVVFARCVGRDLFWRGGSE